MGRKREKHFNLPPGLYARKRGRKVFYYFRGADRKEQSFGSDYVAAVRKWGEQNKHRPLPDAARPTFETVAQRYEREVIPGKAPRTQQDNHKELAQLRKFFCNPSPVPLDALMPMHVRQYLDWRTQGGKVAKVRATREKALLSHMWNMARAWGMTDRANPCEGIEGWGTGRKVYFENEVLDAIYAESADALRDAFDLAYLSGQRVNDVRLLMESHVRDGTLSLQQGKTQTRIRMEVTNTLAGVIDRIRQRKRALKSSTLALLVDERGRAMTYRQLNLRFVAARDKVIEKFRAAGRADLATLAEEVQFRDLRAKAGTDKLESTNNIVEAQRQLGHSTVTMTEKYIRNRRGQLVTPTK